VRPERWIACPASARTHGDGSPRYVLKTSRNSRGERAQPRHTEGQEDTHAELKESQQVHDSRRGSSRGRAWKPWMSRSSVARAVASRWTVIACCRWVGWSRPARSEPLSSEVREALAPRSRQPQCAVGSRQVEGRHLRAGDHRWLGKGVPGSEVRLYRKSRGV